MIALKGISQRLYRYLMIYTLIARALKARKLGRDEFSRISSRLREQPLFTSTRANSIDAALEGHRGSSAGWISSAREYQLERQLALQYALKLFPAWVYILRLRHIDRFLSRGRQTRILI